MRADRRVARSFVLSVLRHRSVVALLGGLVTYGCREPAGPDTSVASVVVTPASVTLVSVGQTTPLAAKALNAAGEELAGKTFTWSSTNTAAATVTSTGLVTAVANGSATVTASSESRTATAAVTVSQAVENVVVSPPLDTIDADGQTVQLSALARDANGTAIPGVTFTWSSLSGAIATVSSSGLVTPRANGTTTIFAAIGDNSGHATIVVKIVYVPVAGAWAGFTDQNYSVSFRVRDQKVERLQATIAAAVDAFTTCITPFSAAPTPISLTTGVLADSLSHPAFTLSRKVAISGTLTSSTRLAGTIGGYNGSFSVNCGSDFSGSKTLWSDIALEARPITVIDAAVKFAYVEASASHSCGLTASGAAYCWGSGGSGRLGNGSFDYRTVPDAVSGGLTFTALSVGSGYTCGLTSAGVAYCWGQSLVGQLGDGTTTERLLPTPVAGGHTFSSLNAGASHTCGLLASGAAYCWGSNFFGQLGDTAYSRSLVPVAVRSSLTFASISVGNGQTCGIVSTGTAGTAYCWGLGYAGNGTPVAIPHTSAFASLSAGRNHVCALTAAGTAFCWGSNASGQLGNGTTTTSSTPVQVAGGLTFTSITAGDDYTCATTSANVGYCWGSNFYGKMGVADLIGDFPVPTAVFGEVAFTAISAGPHRHSCGVSRDGVAYCWGSNDVAQLGLGRREGIVDVPLPVVPRYP